MTSSSHSGDDRWAPGEAWARLARGRLIDALRRVESLPPESAGALLVGDAQQPAGMILVERNRVCWAAAVGMSQRLRDILSRRCQRPLGDESLEALYERCRREHRAVGETLVAEGLVSSDEMREAMEEHTLESLLTLDTFDANSSEWPLTWVERPGRGYDPRYTFAGTELLAAVGARALDEAATEVLEDHLETLRGAASLLAFAPAATIDCSGHGAHHGLADMPLICVAQSALPLSIDEILDLARWADAALEASPGFHPATALGWARQSTAGGAVAWNYEGRRCAAVCPSGPALERLVSALDHQSLAMVLAMKNQVLDRVRQRTRFAE